MLSGEWLTVLFQDYSLPEKRKDSVLEEEIFEKKIYVHFLRNFPFTQNVPAIGVQGNITATGDLGFPSRVGRVHTGISKCSEVSRN